MMMRLRCTEKLQLIATADPLFPSSPLPRLHSSSLTHCTPPSPQVCPFASMYSKWNSLSHWALLWQASFDLLIHWVNDESDSSLFESIQVYSHRTRITNKWKTQLDNASTMSESSVLSISTSISLINRNSIGNQLEYEVRQLIKQWMVQLDALKSRAHESSKWKRKLYNSKRELKLKLRLRNCALNAFTLCKRAFKNSNSLRQLQFCEVSLELLETFIRLEFLIIHVKAH